MYLPDVQVVGLAGHERKRMLLDDLVLGDHAASALDDPLELAVVLGDERRGSDDHALACDHAPDSGLAVHACTLVSHSFHSGRAPPQPPYRPAPRLRQTGAPTRNGRQASVGCFPLGRHAARTALGHDRAARELKAAGWKLGEVGTDNGSEFRARHFRERVDELGARQRFIKAGRPNSNGCVERLQLTILEECWRPAFARSLVPKLTALQRDLDEYLTDYNFDRAHTGRLTKGRVPADIVFGARKTRTVR